MIFDGSMNYFYLFNRHPLIARGLFFSLYNYCLLEQTIKQFVTGKKKSFIFYAGSCSDVVGMGKICCM